MSGRTQTEHWLASFVVPDPPRGGASLALTRSLVTELGSPQHAAPAVHIVGTAGKGSVAVELTARLVAAGMRVATHQSPHVHDVRERFMLDGTLPPWDEVGAAVAEVTRAVEVVERSHGVRPTFFAVTAALSWVLGRRHDADVFVTEAGIGGRGDATAVLARPDTLTVVTRIGLDHTEVLGETVAAIAREKASVMAGRRRAVLAPQPETGVADVVREIASAEGVDLFEVTGSFADWRDEASAITDVVSSMLADAFGRPIPTVPGSVAPGRLEERFLAGRRLVLDGAHNAMKLAALAEVLVGDPPAIVIAAVGATKDLEACAAGLVALGAPVVAVEFGGQPGPRSHPADELANMVVRLGGRADVAVDAIHAARCAVGSVPPGAMVLVTGSFLVLGDVAEAFESLVAR